MVEVVWKVSTWMGERDRACTSRGFKRSGEDKEKQSCGTNRRDIAGECSLMSCLTEFTQDGHLLTTFPTPRPESIASLLKQLHHFVRPSGKKPALPFSPPGDVSRTSGSPYTTRDGMTPADSDEERPRKRSRTATNEDMDQGEGDISSSPRQGKKPGGKTAGKGTKPRTVVRGARGLIPMEIDAAGDQHIAGRLPDSAVRDEKVDEDEEEEDDVPLAKRPQLDEGERRRREVIKVKEKEREDEVVLRLAKGVNVEDTGQILGKAEPDAEVEMWEGVELVGPLAFQLSQPLMIVSAQTSCTTGSR